VTDIYLGVPHFLQEDSATTLKNYFIVSFHILTQITSAVDTAVLNGPAKKQEVMSSVITAKYMCIFLSLCMSLYAPLLQCHFLKQLTDFHGIWFDHCTIFFSKTLLRSMRNGRIIGLDMNHGLF
jgi:hypothetical protein